MVVHDLRDVHMQWPLSCYGLNTSWDQGDNVFNGDHSPEELRCEAYAQMRSVGNLNSYLATLNHVMAEQRAHIATFINDPMRAVAVSKTPRTTMTPSLPQSDLTPNVIELSSAVALPGAMPTPPDRPSQPKSQDGQGDGDSLYKNFTLGNIPELPPP